jgi:hypothetical protein
MAGTEIWPEATYPVHRAMVAVAARPQIQTNVTPASATDGPHSPEWRNALTWGLITYLVSRVMVIAGAAAVSAARVSAVVECENRGLDICGERPRSAAAGIIEALTSWDGQWYFSLIRHGYPTSVPAHITYAQPEARAAFFPLYPWLVHAVDVVLPGSDVTAALVLNFFLGLAFVVTMGALARAWTGVESSKRTMMIAALYPGSFVLSFAYSEALFLLLAALSMLAWHRYRYVIAGLLAAGAAFTRPNAIALIAAYLVGSLLLLRSQRNWKSLITPLIAPLGFIGAQAYIAWRAHEPRVWFRVQSEAWGEGVSFGGTAVRRVVKFIVHPLSSPSNLITVLAILSLIIGVAALFRSRLPAYAVIYVAVISMLMFLPETVTARPRFVYSAFPLMVAVGAAWPKRWSSELWGIFLALCGSALFGLSVLYGLYAVVIP